MTGGPGGERPQRLTFGAVRLLRVQVGYRAGPDDSAYQQNLLDLPLQDEDQQAFEEAQVLPILEPILHAGADTPRHYSLHEYRRHTSWGLSPNELKLSLVVMTGARSTDIVKATDDAVLRAFRDLRELVGRRHSEALSRDDALLRARQAAATAFEVELESLWPGTEEHHPDAGSWRVGLRTNDGEQYDVLVGFVDGYAGSARVRHARPTEVSDSLGGG